jgi:hypothetical protein
MHAKPRSLPLVSPAAAATLLLYALAAPASAQTGGGFDLSWWSVDCGGGVASSGSLSMTCTLGQPDAGQMSGGAFTLSGGFLGGGGGPPPCYANCDGSTSPPVLTVNDFICFQSQFASGASYANCDGSTSIPTLTVNDFICFQSHFAAGCP